MKRVLLLSCVLGAISLRAGAGSVKTSDGKEFEGDVRLECGGVVISRTNQPEVRVALTNLALLRLSSDAGALPSSSAGVAVGETGAKSPSPTGRTESLPPPKASAGILLTSGSFVARRISAADDSTVRFFDSTNEVVLSTLNVSRIVFQPIPGDVERRVPRRRTGLLLGNNEFVEGDFKEFKEGQISFSSIQLGIVRYEPSQVIAVIFREPKPSPTVYELRTCDDSVFLANDIRIETSGIVLEDKGFGGFRIAPQDLMQLERR